MEAYHPPDDLLVDNDPGTVNRNRLGNSGRRASPSSPLQQALMKSKEILEALKALTGEAGGAAAEQGPAAISRHRAFCTSAQPHSKTASRVHSISPRLDQSQSRPVWKADPPGSAHPDGIPATDSTPWRPAGIGGILEKSPAASPLSSPVRHNDHAQHVHLVNPSTSAQRHEHLDIRAEARERVISVWAASCERVRHTSRMVSRSLMQPVQEGKQVPGPPPDTTYMLEGMRSVRTPLPQRSLKLVGPPDAASPPATPVYPPGGSLSPSHGVDTLFSTPIVLGVLAPGVQQLDLRPMISDTRSQRHVPFMIKHGMPARVQSWMRPTESSAAQRGPGLLQAQHRREVLRRMAARQLYKPSIGARSSISGLLGEDSIGTAWQPGLAAREGSPPSRPAGADVCQPDLASGTLCHRDQPVVGRGLDYLAPTISILKKRRPAQKCHSLRKWRMVGAVWRQEVPPRPRENVSKASRHRQADTAVLPESTARLRQHIQVMRAAQNAAAQQRLQPATSAAPTLEVRGGAGMTLMRVQGKAYEDAMQKQHVRQMALVAALAAAAAFGLSAASMPR